MPARSDPLFPVAQRLILSLYDGGVLSPAVLERVIVAIGEKAWDTKPDALSSDGRSLRAIVVSVMMPGAPLDNVDRDFTAVVKHIVSVVKPSVTTTRRPARRAGGKSAGPRASSVEENLDNEPALIEQLAGRHGIAGKRTKYARGDTKGKSPATFNPLFNAAIPKK